MTDTLTQWAIQGAVTVVIAVFGGTAAGRREARVVQQMMEKRLDRIEDKLDRLIEAK